MKRMKEFPRLETRTVALLTGLAVGLAIAVHDIFFVVAALIALVAPIESAVHWIHEHMTHRALAHRHSRRHRKTYAVSSGSVTSQD